MQFKMAEPPEGVEDESPRCLEVIGASSNSSQQCFVKRVFFVVVGTGRWFSEMYNANNLFMEQSVFEYDL